MCFLTRCVTSPHAALLSTACAAAIPQHCDWHHASSLVMAACHAQARPAAALCLVHSCSQDICAACKVLQGTLSRDRLTPPPSHEHDCVMAQLVSAGKSLLRPAACLSAPDSPCNATLPKSELPPAGLLA